LDGTASRLPGTGGAATGQESRSSHLRQRLGSITRTS
jgi:hypothetical protein